jgi:GAF domain-containing protein
VKRTVEVLESAEEVQASSDEVFRAACRDVADATGANRVSIWEFDPQRESIRCACFYEAPLERFTSGQILTAREHPNYFRTILREKFIIAPDARSHPATADLVDPYFRDHDIYSLLDFIIHDSFKPIGVVCCENAGAIREWRDEDVSYLRQISTLISFRLKR